MKHTLILISMLFCASLQVQAQVLASNQQEELTMAQVLTHKAAVGENEATTKLRTTETAVQSHDGKPVYKTVREVEYTFKETATKIIRKRKVLSSATERLSSDVHIEEVYPDITAVLLSGVFSPKNVKKQEDGFKMPCFVTVNSEGGTAQVLFDKLAVLQYLGKTTTDSTFGTQISYDVITEQLQYGLLSEKLYIDQLERVQSIVVLTTTEKSGSSHRVEVREDILVR